VANAGLIDDISVENINYQINSGVFGWQASYDIEFTNQDLIIDVDIFLTGDDAGPTLENIWETGIENLWSNTFDIFDGSFYYDTVFNIDWLDTQALADHTVNVHNGNGNVNLANWYTGNPSGWGFHNQGRIAAHEFGHMIGLFDEYVGGALDPSGLIRHDSIMGKKLTLPQEDHFDDFTDWLKLNSGSNLISLEPDTGSYHYQVSVPEPSTLVIFSLGIVGLVSRRFKHQA
jgi:hypothetical protein